MRAAQRGRQRSTPLPTATILMPRAAEHSAIDFLFQAPPSRFPLRHSSCTPSHARGHRSSGRQRWWGCSPLRFPSGQTLLFPLACGCCCSTYCLPQTGCADRLAQMSRRARRLLCHWRAAYRGSGDRSKGLCEVHCLSSVPTARCRPTVRDGLFFLPQCVQCCSLHRCLL